MSFILCFVFVFFKQNQAYELCISDLISDVCPSDLLIYGVLGCRPRNARGRPLGKDSKLKPSAGALALKQAKLEHPIVNHIIRAMEDVMESDKQMSNVTGRLDTEGRVEGGIRFYTDRFRTAYGAAGTTSTRLSSKSSDFWEGTNAHNIRGKFRD